MAMLQAYKADFLKDVNDAGGVAPDAIEDLLHNTDLTLLAAFVANFGIA